MAHQRSDDNVRSKVVLVVGGTSGIGLVTARRLVDEGARVAVCSRSEERVSAVAAELGHGTLGLPGDIRDAADMQRVVAACLAEHGRLDAVVTTAQVMAYGTLEEVPPETFAAVHDVAVLGTLTLARTVLPVFRAQGGGSLVIVGSLLAEIAVPSLGAYCTAKWAQLCLARTLQLETRRERGIHVSVVAPGAIDTPIYAQAATFAGHGGSAPPPVLAPDHVARAIVRVLDCPRRLVHVGPANWLSVIGFRLMPGVYDRLAPLLVRRVVLRGPRVAATLGNVVDPQTSLEGPRGGWTWYGRRRR
ncbi:SDR family NAD(P)-dependent oxidoreductase [Nocardioides sp.]|uniref:SDR family NAD(P)-dependent oxidoreductase n=1 Tax=Nocardioides sp. TaxID=35761 RepID=UPI002B2681FD|nr:SDR family NAD(P)-dependent oxidoreductase [Nocardioides sp.]